MADTQRDTATLMSLLADNTSGAISAQDLRDTIASILGGYGGLKLTAPAAAQAMGVAPAKLTGWDATLDSDGANVVASASLDTITPAIAAKYEVHVDVSAKGSASEEFLIAVYVNGAATSVKAIGVSDVNGYVSPMHASGIINVGAGQAVDVRCNTSNVGKTITMQVGTFWIKRLS